MNVLYVTLNIMYVCRQILSSTHDTIGRTFHVKEIVNKKKKKKKMYPPFQWQMTA